MAKKFDLTGSDVAQQKRAERALGTQTPLASSTVERGSTHWTEGSNVNIDGLLGIDGTGTVTGTLGVSGLLSVSGTLNASGSINLSGSTGITGPLNVTGTTTIGGNTSITGELVVTGPTTLDGITDIGGDTTITGLLDVQGDTTVSGKLDVTGPMSTEGTLDVKGVTTLSNDLNVVDGGVVKAGQVEIHPENGGNIAFTGAAITNGGSVGFSFSATTQNAQVESISGQAALKGSNSSVVARAGAVDVNASTTHISGVTNHNGITNFNAAMRYINRPTPTGSPANMYVNPSTGYIYESTSSERFKTDIQPLELDPRLLDVPLVDWVDKASKEAYDLMLDSPRPFEYEDQMTWDCIMLTRHAGATAESVLAAGGAPFVGFDPDGQPRSLAYDRFALARTALLHERVKNIEQRLGY